MWFGFRSSFGTGVVSTFGCIPNEVVFTMISISDSLEFGVWSLELTSCW